MHRNKIYIELKFHSRPNSFHWIQEQRRLATVPKHLSLKKQLCNRIYELNAINHTRVVHGPTRSDPNPKLQARTRK